MESDFQDRLTNTFDSLGYVVLEDILDDSMALHLRDYIGERFTDGSATSPYDIVDHKTLGSIKLDVFNRFPEIYRQIFFGSHFIINLKALLGEDFVIIPDTAIHKNSFGTWHKDSRAQQAAGLQFHWEDDFQIVTIGLYFQTNTPEFGGGLEVIPGAHKIRYPQYPTHTKGEIVRSKPGDMVIFNHNLDHKATSPSRELNDAHTKFSLFLSASRNNSHVENYMQFLKMRPDYGWIRNYTYPSDLINHAKGHGYGLAV